MLPRYVLDTETKAPLQGILKDSDVWFHQMLATCCVYGVIWRFVEEMSQCNVNNDNSIENATGTSIFKQFKNLWGLLFMV